ncbi:MAG: terminase small subunit [Saezia sp.]
MMTELTAKQEAFCREYIVDLNAKRAAIRAGYSVKTAQVQGCRMLGSGKVKARVDELMQMRQERKRITPEYVLVEAMRVYERCMQDVAPVLKKGEQEQDAAGNAVYAFDVKSALSALELMGKHVLAGASKDKAAALESAEPLEQVVAMSEKERADRVAKLLALAQARREEEDGQKNALESSTEEEIENVENV